MTEITPLARKLRTAYRNSDATGDALWNEMAEVVEDELVAPRPVRLPTVEECHQEFEDRRVLEGYPTGNYWVWGASIVLDLAAKLNPTWVEVPPDATIPAGTRMRVEYQEYANRAQEWAAEVDKTPAMWQTGGVCLVPSGTVLEFPLDPRIKRAHAIIPALQRVKNVPLGGDLLPAALEAIDAIDALEFPLDPRIEATARAIYIADNQGGDDQCWDTVPTSIRDIYVELAKAAAEALGVTL